MKETATAHLEWDQRWQTAEGRADWLTPEADIVQFTETLKADKSYRVLDLGCGVGRHAIHFAQLGFETYALDESTAGLAYIEKAAGDRHLTIQCAQGSMTALPYETGFFDYVLAFNVIYHGDLPVVTQSLEEIHRVLKPGGFFQGTLLSKRNSKYGQGTEISPNTFVIESNDDANDGDKDHPHFYCNAQELCQLLTGFEPLSLVDQVHTKPGSWHWHLVAERM